MKLAGLAIGFVAVVGVALALAAGGGHRPKTVADTLTPKIVACERSGKLTCDRAAYRRDRAHGEFPLGSPDPKGSHLMTLQQVLPPAWRHKDYAAELMTYGQARKIAPGLAGATRVSIDPSRKFWVLTLYHHPPVTEPMTWGPPGRPATIRVRVESQTIDAVTGQGMDECVNCTAIRELRYAPEGVTLMAAVPGYRPPISRDRAVAAFRSSGIAGSDLIGRLSVKLWTVRDVRLPSGGYPAWAITFPHTSPTSYGIGPVSQKPDCAWVAIYDLQTRVWTDDFQNCPENIRPSPEGTTCDSGCTPANQGALDAAASDAEKIAGAAHVYTGTSIDDTANKVVLYLDHAPQSVVGELEAAHPGTYVIHNDTPRTYATLMRLVGSFDFKILEPEGIRVFSVGPSVDGYLDVGVSDKVAEAQRKLDAVYGPGVVRVSKGEPAVFDNLNREIPPFSSPVRSTRVREASAAEVRMWRTKPRAFITKGVPTRIRFVLTGGVACKPKARFAQVHGTTLAIYLRRPRVCTLDLRFFEVTVNFTKPILDRPITKVVLAGYDKRNGQAVSLAVVSTYR